MIYSKFLKKGDTIGICAPSSGIEKGDASFEVSLNHLKSEGYNIIETENVRTGLKPSADKKIRAKEFNELMQNDDVDFIFSASGGDYLIEILPFLDEVTIKSFLLENKSKWVAGYSDPTSLLFYLTTKFDIATIYGVNAGSFGMNALYRNLQDALELIKGNILKQESFEKCERISFEEKCQNGEGTYVLNTPVEWKNLNGNVDISGRLIGGCIDCLQYLVGTRFDYVEEFVERYKQDGIIWYFDNFSLRPDEIFSVLWEMGQASWFKNIKGVVFGRTLIEDKNSNMSYEDAIKRVFGDKIPIIYDADIGHVRPTFNIINGSIGHFISKDGKGSLEMKLS